MILLIILLLGLGGLIYWQFGDQLLSFFNSSTGGGGGSTVVDTTKPEITSIVDPSVDDGTLGPKSASINWTTDELASSRVDYGTTSAYGTSKSEPETGDPTYVVSHSVVLTDLQPETTYHYRVKSKDAAGNEAVSDDKTFTTTAL